MEHRGAVKGAPQVVECISIHIAIFRPTQGETHLLGVDIDGDVLQVGFLLLGVAAEVQHLLQVAEERHLADYHNS